MSPTAAAAKPQITAQAVKEGGQAAKLAIDKAVDKTSAVVAEKVAEVTKSWTKEQKIIAAVAVAAVAVPSLAYVIGRLCYRCQRRRGNKDANGYESDEAARQYMEFHYTPSRESYTQRLRSISEAFDFPTRVAQKFKVHLPAGKHGLRGLDIGCATGASALEMTRFFDGGVIGIDLSEGFIHLANEVLESTKSAEGTQRVKYTAPVQGDISELRGLQLSPNVLPDRVSFYAGDAMRLFPSDGKVKGKSSRYPDVEYWQAKEGEKFDGVLCLNLLDRVPDPAKLLRSFGALLNTGGVLILADPYSWFENATPKRNWIGAGRDGKRSEEMVKAALSQEFDLKTESDEAFLIRNHSRHYQLGFSHCTVWKKK